VKKILALLLCAVPLASAFYPSFGGAYNNPGTPSGFINDYASLLSQDQRHTIETNLKNFEKTTGNEIAVVTIPSLKGDTIENFAVKLFQDWGIGKKGKDNGVLFLIAKDDRKFRIEVGYGLEGNLTDAQSFAILDGVVKPAFKNGDYYSGISNGIHEIEKAIQGEALPVANDQSNTNDSNTNSLFLWLIFIVFFISLRALPRTKSWWGGGVVGAMIAGLISLLFSFIYIGAISFIILIPLGFIFDYFTSRSYQKNKALGIQTPWMIWMDRSGRGGPSSGSGFGGFGGGSSGGGGASGDW